MNRILTVFTSGALLFFTYGCGIGGNYIPADSLAKAVSTFKLIAPSNSLPVGSKIKLTPIIVQTNGETPANPAIEWKVSDDKLAKVEADGTLTALADGSVTVTAKYGGQETTAVIAIARAPGSANPSNPGGTDIKNTPSLNSRIKSIVVKLPTETTPVIDYKIEKLDGTLKFEAKAYDVDNKVLEDVTFTWSSSNNSVATITSTGTVTAVATGSTNIIATAGDKTSNIVRLSVPNGKANINVNFQGD